MSDNDESLYVDGYVFYAKRSSWLNVCQLWHDGVIRFAVKNLTGPDVIVAFVGEKPGHDAGTKRDHKLEQAEQAANPTFSSAKSTLITVNAPSRWSQKQPFAAHLRIKAEAQMERAVYDAFDPTGPNPPFRQGQGYNGHALCKGKWDVLVELGANSPAELDALVNVARTIPNIKSMIVTTAAMPPTPPDPPTTCEPWLDDPAK